MKTPLEVASNIERIIEALRVEGLRSEELIKAKAESMGEYDRLVAVTTSNMRGKGEPVTLVNKLSGEFTHKALIAKIVAEETLKAHYSRIGVLEAQLNGYQSINRYLQSTSRGE